ncbi:MAG TPA: UDP-N-acetylmuramate dehydrogenase [Spirochaetia bacterium]|nr:UDP-N-acetylmuramate dehydrogenase [Spirochaetales bacterium]HRW24344.1 UDP-N-acetylmuramate dehydrogenase [Spirochaetia bacterium]
MSTLRKFLEKCNIDAEIAYDEPMARHTSFRIGGPADALVRPRTAEAAAALLAAARDDGVPVAAIGGGANLLVADSGVRGIVLSTELLRGLDRGDDGSLYAEAGLPVVELVRVAIGAGLAGLEFAAGLPGSVGGAVYMNARCYDREFADALVGIAYLDPLTLGPATAAVDRSAWAYKRTPFMPGGALAGALILGARFGLAAGDRAALEARAAELEADRATKGHFDYPCAGSVFKNDRSFGRPTGRILDELGFRGRRVGDAMVSPKHANIFVNAGRASAADMRALIAMAIAEAKAAFGVELEPEVVMLGDF